MTDASAFDVWASGDPYERYVGRWSRPVAAEFLRWLALPAGLRWLDVGCGTGALATAIVGQSQPLQVHGVEPSEGFLAIARERLGDDATLLPGTAAQLPLPSASMDVVVSGLMLNFVPNLPDALAEMQRVLRPGATLAAYVWDYAAGMELMRHFWDAAVSLHPGALSLDEGLRFPLCRPAPLQTAFTEAGLAAVEVVALNVATNFRDFDDYWAPFLGGQGPAPAFACSLDEGSRQALRDRLQQCLPTSADGSIRLQARAWAVRGRRAGA